MKVFYSWQSDTPARIGKAFIREALETAIADLDLEEAERPEIDQDTKGVLGSPVIADIIFQKIRAAKVVVTDVTLTGSTPAGKRLCNSNVAIELGYALNAHGYEVLLKLMNTHYGPPKDLPFDLAHRRWPVEFSLAPDADKAERDKAREELAKKLKPILEAYVAASRPAPQIFTPTTSTYNAAAYWQPGESLAIEENREGSASLVFGADRPLIYLRIWPTAKIAPPTIHTLNDHSKSNIEPLCGTASGWTPERNRHGLLMYDRYGAGDGLTSTTQVMNTGEIWGVNARLLRSREGEVAYPKFVPTGAYERGLRESLSKYLNAARAHFGYPPKIMVESGLVNIASFKLAMSNYDFWGPIFKDVVVQAEVDIDKPDTITAALLKIYEAVFEAAGTPRPPNHDNFPAKTA